jgi:hypothetical protein
MLGFLYTFLLGSPRKRPAGVLQLVVAPDKFHSSDEAGVGCFGSGASSRRGATFSTPLTPSAPNKSSQKSIASSPLLGFSCEARMEVERRLHVIERTISKRYILGFSLTESSFERVHGNRSDVK